MDKRTVTPAKTPAAPKRPRISIDQLATLFGESAADQGLSKAEQQLAARCQVVARHVSALRDDVDELARRMGGMQKQFVEAAAEFKALMELLHSMEPPNDGATDDGAPSVSVEEPAPNPSQNEAASPARDGKQPSKTASVTATAPAKPASSRPSSTQTAQAGSANGRTGTIQLVQANGGRPGRAAPEPPSGT